MKSTIKKIFYTVLLLATATSASAQKSGNGDTSAIDKLNRAAFFIDRLYVDDVNLDSLVDQAIISMLHTLDPHSQYSTPDETRELNAPLEGKFSGIGIQFNMSTDTVYVVQTIPGGPSEKVGIRAGDRIIAADDSIIAGRHLKNSDITKILRGEKGSKVRLYIKRGNSPELIEFVVIRDDIPMECVDAAYMVTPTIGYISLSRFVEDAGKEVAEAIKKLQAQGMKRLIFDLQGNGGGYLSAAVDVASLFLDNGDLVTFTKGRAVKDEYYHVKTSRPLFTGPLVVLVDQYSASASEIVSGAIQDNDRGLIVGRRTYGKGLVQRPIPFPDGSMMRLTTSRYYTPTGRSIQKHYDKGHSEDYALDLLNRYESGELWSADSIHFDESQRYHTLRNGRTVYGGGGIMPDAFVPLDTTYNSTYYRDLVAKNVLNPYVLSYLDANRQKLKKEYPTQDLFVRNFEVTPAMIADLVRRGEAQGVALNQQQLDRSLPMIKASIKGLLLRDLFVDGVYVRATNPLNPIFVEGLRQIQYGTMPDYSAPINRHDEY